MMLLRTALYRLGQVKQQLGFVAPLTANEQSEVALWLPNMALKLFYTMSLADQRHSLRVCRGLQAQGCTEVDMLAAALLHDVGKAQGRVPFWTRPVIVIGKAFAPRLLNRLVLPFTDIMQCVGMDVSRPGPHTDGATEDAIHPSLPQTMRRRGLIYHALVTSRRSLNYAWWHAEVGAMLAAEAGLSERAVLYIRTHHQPHGPAAALHLVDEES